MKSTESKYRLEVRYELIRDGNKNEERITRKKTFHGIHADNPSELMDSIGLLNSGILRKRNRSRFLESFSGFLIRFVQTWRGTYEDFYKL